MTAATFSFGTWHRCHGAPTLGLLLGEQGEDFLLVKLNPTEAAGQE
jgi:hypothetical protein